jgi:hypothetical protein
MLLKPLEEFIAAVGMRDCWRPKLQEILKGMAPIFPYDKQNKITPATALLDSYL